MSRRSEDRASLLARLETELTQIADGILYQQAVADRRLGLSLSDLKSLTVVSRAGTGHRGRHRQPHRASPPVRSRG